MVRFKAFRSAVCAGLLLGIGLSHQPANAQPVQFGTNYYDFVFTGLGVTWDSANTGASASSFNGVSGHLATITSQAENDFLSSQFTISPSLGWAGSWIGGQVDASGTGSWQVGPEVGQAFSLGQSPLPGQYANWGGIEPNDASSTPDAVYMHIGTIFINADGQIDRGKWADAAFGISDAHNDRVMGYFVEYESPVAAIPEPETYAMLLVGLGVLGFAARRRKLKEVAA